MCIGARGAKGAKGAEGAKGAKGVKSATDAKDMIEIECMHATQFITKTHCIIKKCLILIMWLWFDVMS